MKIELTNQEALVLFEWLKQNSEKDELFAHRAEQYVLWCMEAQLDKALLEPCLSDYEAILRNARTQVEESW